MSGKSGKIENLVKNTTLQVSDTPQEWLHFLSFSAYFYKYSFQDKLYIYAQKPNATACATLPTWNEPLHCRVKAGTKGIALLRNKNGHSKLEYVFDISDVYPMRNAEKPQLWEMDKEFEPVILNRLSLKYGKVSTNEFAESLMDLTRQAVENMESEYFSILLSQKEDSNISHIPHYMFRRIVLKLVTASVQFSILTRCGIDTQNYLTTENFENIKFFQNTKLFYDIGQLISILSRQILKEVEYIIKNKEIDIEKVEISADMRYNHLKVNQQLEQLIEELKGGYTYAGQENAEDKIHSGGNGNYLPPGGGLSDTRLGAERAEGHWMVRTDEAGIYEKTRQFDSANDDNRGYAEQLSDENQRTSLRQNPRVDVSDGRKSRGERGNESRQSDAVGTGNEQLQGNRRGNREGRIDKQLNTGPTKQISLQTENTAENIAEAAHINESVHIIEETMTTDIKNINETDNSTEAEEHSPASFFITPNQEQDDNNSLEKEVSISPTELTNYEIKDNALGIGGAKVKFNANILAIQTLKAIEAENRSATPGEQEILSKYVGWGGLSQAFDPTNEKWAKEYIQLKELLSTGEYEAARKSILDAYYTPPIIIDAIYQALRQTGLQKGKILEPSCGTGHFFGLLPKDMKDLTLYGVEIDSITGRIAQQLYPKAHIAISGFEKTSYPDNYFDIAVGNVPFGDTKVPDAKYNHLKFNIHDYFIAKTLDLIHPGGIIALITSKGVMDKANPRVRKYLAKQADLLGAVRLPNNAFYQNAGTDVTADILFFRKRETPPKELPEWVEIGENNEGIPINQYFIKNPDMILGKMEFWDNMYGNKKNTACIPFENANLSQQLTQAISKIQIPEIPFIKTNKEQDIPDMVYKEEMNLKNFNFHMVDGQLYYRENQLLKPVVENRSIRNRIADMIKLRNCTRQLLDAQVNNCENEELYALQQQLNQEYDSFINKHGFLHSTENRKAFQNDTSYPLLCSLEFLNEDKTALKRKADIFYKRTIKQVIPVTHVQTAQEALIMSINEKACVDLGYMASLMGGSQYIETIKQDLKGMIFKNPLKGDDPFIGWETADEYLSGNVRKKLEIAEEAIQRNDAYSINVEKLAQVQPEDLTATEIEVHIGTAWIDREYYEQFMHEILDTNNKRKITLEYSALTNRWHINQKQSENYNLLVSQAYGTNRMNAYEILEKTLNLQDIIIKDSKIDVNGNKISVVNEQETSLVLDKQEALQQEFDKWIWEDSERREALCKKYNRMFNNIQPRQYDGSHLFLNGINPEIHLRPHQSNAVARMLFGGNTLLAHAVGAGKTFEMIAAAMESKRLGLCHKSLFVVPNHIIEQWGADFLTLYPNANILIASKQDFEKKNRQE